MADIQITTTQNVKINFKMASVGHRILASIVDSLIKLAYLFVVFWSLAQLSSFFEFIDLLYITDQWSAVAIILVISLPAILYTLLTETFMHGQTLGKRLFKIKVVKIDGYQAHILDYFMRWVSCLIDVYFAIGFPGIVGLIVIGSSKNSQRIGGLASGTAVVDLRRNINISHTILQDISTDYQPTYPSVVQLTDNDVRIIKEHFLKAQKKNDYPLMVKVKEKVIATIDVKPKKEHNAKKFLDTIIKDYNYYTQK